MTTAYEEMAEAYKRAEQTFSALHIPSDVWLQMADRHSDSIGWAKASGHWRLCHRNSYDSDPVPVLECSTKIRIDVAPLLSKLYQLCKETVNQRAKDILHAVDLIEAFCESVNPPSKEKEVR